MSSVEILQNLSDLLVTNNIFKDLLRELGWGLVMFLKKLIDIIDTVVQNTYKIINFVSSTIIENNIGVLSGIMVAILAISIAILGYKLIFKRDNKSNAFTGALLVIVVMMALPIIFNQGVKIVSSLSGSVSISTNTDEGLLSDRVIKSNLHDLMKYAKYDNFKLPSNVTTYNDIPPSILKHIDMSEVLENSEIPNSKNKGVINKELDFDKNGNIVDKKFNGNMLTGRDGYYRYYVNWFSIIANFIIVGITLLLMGVKTVKIVFNLALDRIVGTILILTDIEEGKRAKELLTHIISTFAVLMVSVFSMNLYSEFTGWIQTQQLGSGWIGVITNLVVLLGTSIALLEGPSIIQKLLGTQIESGVARTTAQMYGANKLGKSAVGGGISVGKSAFRFGKSAIKMADKTGLTETLNKGAMKVTDAYGKAADKYGIHNLDDISNNKSGGNNIDSSNGITNSDTSSNSDGSKQKFEGGTTQDSNNKPQSKSVRVAGYSGIEQDMKESGFNKENDQENQSWEGNEATDKYSNDNINSYKSNIPDELDFNEALNNHDKQTYNKRMNLNANRRQQRLDSLNTIGKHNLNSNKDNDVIPRNFTKKGEDK
ncbi:pLS20_p028 family conjugation system transmembrane protein [Clostridium nigeriense]|uniref:pLS20_p028 family conjugation system transmembrane protein n=1 Tax=Clostridium nigeriense TaxID=1805470 RepID=UPI003D327D66